MPKTGVPPSSTVLFKEISSAIKSWSLRAHFYKHLEGCPTVRRHRKPWSGWLYGLDTAENVNCSTLKARGLGSGVGRFVQITAAKGTQVPEDGDGANGQFKAGKKGSKLYGYPDDIVFL